MDETVIPTLNKQTQRQLDEAFLRDQGEPNQGEAKERDMRKEYSQPSLVFGFDL
jgi:hypothetical protein